RRPQGPEARHGRRTRRVPGRALPGADLAATPNQAKEGAREEFDGQEAGADRMNWGAYAGHPAVFASMGLTLVCVVLFKALHKRDARRSPFEGKQVGHLPGQQLLQRMHDHHDELLMSVLLMFLAFPLAF